MNACKVGDAYREQGDLINQHFLKKKIGLTIVKIRFDVQ
jgi:hypothetical protein